MPTYEYECSACGHRFEKFQSITARPLKKCPECEEKTLQRLIGTGAGIIFKGSGFYQTDYRSDDYKKAAKAEKDAATGGAKTSEDKSKDTKPAEKKTPDKAEKAPTKSKKSSAA